MHQSWTLRPLIIIDPEGAPYVEKINCKTLMEFSRVCVKRIVQDGTVAQLISAWQDSHAVYTASGQLPPVLTQHRIQFSFHILLIVVLSYQMDECMAIEPYRAEIRWGCG